MIASNRTILAFGLLCMPVCAAASGGHSYRPERGFVPDKQTAIAVAEAVLRPAYGLATVQSQRPFKARLVKDVWIVSGTPKRNLGGVVEVQIRRSNAAIVSMAHGR